MIRIRYSPGECEIAGMPADLCALAGRLKSLALCGSEDVLPCDDSFDPVPYSALIPRLRLTKKEGKDRVSASDDELTISGSSEGLERFASFFDVPSDGDDGWHVHHEYFPGNGFVATDSLPLVIMIEKNRANQRPDGTSAKAPPSNPSQGAAVPHP